MARMVSSVGSSEWEVMRSRVVGGNFIIVERSRAVVRGEPCSTSGNQKWKGTSPSFIAIATVSSIDEVG